jgi:hypothetical protein
VVACPLVEAVLGLAPAIVFKDVIDYLANPGGSFAHLALLVSVGVGAVLLGGLMSAIHGAAR